MLRCHTLRYAIRYATLRYATLRYATMLIIILPPHGRLDHSRKNDRALCTAIWTFVEKMILPIYGRLEPRPIDGVCMHGCVFMYVCVYVYM